MDEFDYASDAESSTAEAAKTEIRGSASGTEMAAPTLRVEELKDDGHSSLSEEVDVLSHGEGGGSHQGSRTDISKSSLDLSKFLPPEDELKENIIKQMDEVEIAPDAESSTAEATKTEIPGSASGTEMAATTLRVEELKDDGHSSLSEEEDLLSHEEGGCSDQGSREPIIKSPIHLSDVLLPDDELLSYIIKQMDEFDCESDAESSTAEATKTEIPGSASGTEMAAPTLRVEELKDDGEEEDVLSHGEGGDSDQGSREHISKSPLDLSKFLPPEDERKGNIIKQMSEVKNASDAESSTAEAAKTEIRGSAIGTERAAPTLRLEELKDDGHNSLSEGEDVLSHEEGGGSERDSRTDISKSSLSLSEFVPPDDELKDKIIKQVEFYFSDANILKDVFFLKHVVRNKMGFVSLKLITSLRKVKSLTKDTRVVAFSLQQSEQLELNEDETRVRRLAPLPPDDAPSRTVVAVNLPFQNPNIEDISELFKTCGEITLVRVLRPGKSISPDIKKHLTQHPDLGSVFIAILEFEHHESARKAVAKTTNPDDWQYGLKVCLLDSHKNKSEKNEKNKTIQEEKIDFYRKKNEMKNKHGSRVEEQREGESLSSGCDLDRRKDNLASGEPGKRKKLQGSRRGNSSELNKVTHNTTQRLSPRNSSCSSSGASANVREKTHGKSPLVTDLRSPNGSLSASAEIRGNGSLWMQRRHKVQEKSSLAARSPGTSPRMGRKLLDQEGVLRQPKGPDGTKGFHWGIGRGKPLNVSAKA